MYCEKFGPFLIYWEALPQLWLCTRSHLNFHIYEENFVFFFISAEYTEWQRPLSVVHSINDGKVSPGWWGGERADIQHSPYFYSSPICYDWPRQKERVTIVMAGKALMAAKKRNVNSPPTKVECSFALTFPGEEQRRRKTETWSKLFFQNMNDTKICI